MDDSSRRVRFDRARKSASARAVVMVTRNGDGRLGELVFPRDYRIRKQTDFDRVYALRVHAADDVLVVRGCRTGSDTPRLGLSVSRKVGNAVVRNRWKRIIREAFRARRLELPPGFDFVVSPRRGATPNFAAVSASLPKLAKKVARRLGAARP